MGLTYQLISTLVCLLVCTSNFAHGHKCDITLQEIIKTLNTLTARKNSCMELTVADVFAAPKNTTEKETFCKAATALRHIYRHHNCLSKHLSGLDRNLSGLANTTCSVNDSKKSTLRDFLERLKKIMKEKYSKC
ncbi:interleukin-4 precursor [Camelus dromedarius]|uniref:Interleukin-4 n=1 Tax=Camelus dromedarius TaxID=9838 RepID=D7REK7_CAMDR|nr:interleukin-4 precursor [Camelus dromedarius]ADH51720.1 interleukin-4 [Camelus dromedarius]